MAVGAKQIPLNCTTFGCWICPFYENSVTSAIRSIPRQKGHVTLLTFEFVYKGSPHSPSPFLHSLQTFRTFRLNIILPCRLRSQKIRLFCSLAYYMKFSQHVNFAILKNYREIKVTRTISVANITCREN